MAPVRYPPILVRLHWILASAIVLMLVFGFALADPFNRFDAAQAAFLRIHAPIGLLILAMMLFRLTVRLQARALPPPPFKRPLLNILLRLYHYGLYVTVLAVALFGLATALRAGQARALIGLRGPIGGGPLIDDCMFVGHALATTLLSCLIVAHVLGALVHRFVWHDGVFDRMTPSAESLYRKSQGF